MGSIHYLVPALSRILLHKCIHTRLEVTFPLHTLNCSTIVPPIFPSFGKISLHGYESQDGVFIHQVDIGWYKTIESMLGYLTITILQLAFSVSANLEGST